MQYKLLIALMSAVFGCLVVATAMATATPANETVPRPGAPITGLQWTTRANFRMPSLFDFDSFRVKYKKQYANGVELARRAKIFLARAFAVFVSSVKYLHRKSSKFLKLNPRSDWTPEERSVGSQDEPRARNSPISEQISAGGSSDPMPAAMAEHVEQLLAEMVARQDQSAELAALLANFEAGQTRQRRSVAEPNKRKRKLSLAQLTDDVGEASKLPARYTPTVASNNPHYEQPFGQPLGPSNESDEGEQVEQVKPIARAEAALIDRQAEQGGYLSYLLTPIKGAANYLRWPQKKSKQSPTDEEDHFYESATSLEDPDLDPGSDAVFLDYRQSGCFMLPKDQRKCGSCYAFTATALMEYHHCKQTGKLVAFSEQYVVDCAKNRVPHLNGCKGGFASDTGTFYSMFGLELAVDYTYKAQQLTCPYASDTSPEHMGHSRVDSVEVKEIDDASFLKPNLIQYYLESRGPLIFSIVTTEDFDDFGGGVDILRCDKEKSGGHAMVLIGHGVEDGLEYWLVRNSYGVRFGLEGHYKVAKDIPVYCLRRIGYIRGEFRKNTNYKGKAVFDELRRKKLLAKFGSPEAQS